MGKNNMILSEQQLLELSDETQDKLLNVLYDIVKQLGSKCRKVIKTIGYLNKGKDHRLCYEIYKDIYLDSFYGNHDETEMPVCFDEFYNNEWQDSFCKEWYLSIYEEQNK